MDSGSREIDLRQGEPSQVVWQSPELTRIGTVLGPYRLLAPLGSGGMATVFAAEHVGLQKRVAVKVLREAVLGDADVRRRFVREGILASRVRHPNVVDVTDVGQDRGHAYLVMEFLEGESLAARMTRHGAMSVERALDILLPIVAGLAAAHRAGVIHRDVKPENIFLARAGEGREISKLLDFGISRVSALGGPRTTDDHVILGTAHYMAPEQTRGGHVDGRADQYALAVVLFEAISGALPYVSDGSNLFELMAEVSRGGAMPLTSRWPSAPPDLSDVLAKALARAPDQRHASMEDLGRQLMRFATSSSVRRFRELVDPGWSSMTLPQQSSPEARDANGSGRLERAEAPTMVATAFERDRPSSKPTLIEAASRAKMKPDAEASAPEATIAARRGWDGRIAVALAAAAALVWLCVLVLPANGVQPSSVPLVLAPIATGAAPRAPGPPEAAAADVVVSVLAEPSSAIISLDGRPVAVGTLRVSLPRGARHHLTVASEGFVRWETLVGDSDRTYRLRLRPTSLDED